MHQADIVIVGGGLAGSCAASMLGRTGLNIVLVDPHPVYRPDFRCEKLDPEQVLLLKRMGLANLVLPLATCSPELWVTRLGRLIDIVPVELHAIVYHDLVNAIRSGIPEHVLSLCGTVTAIELSDGERVVRLMDGDEVRTRLVVLANGLNWALRRSLGIACNILSNAHCTAIGFDITPADGSIFSCESMTYHGERPEDRIAYLSLFKLGESMRANLMTYWTAHDPRLQDFRLDPKTSLMRLMPGLAPLLGEFNVVPPIRVRPADLYVSGNVLQPGLVLIGDAFATSCPAAGTGTGKVFTDVDRLCSAYIPQWFATPGMEVAKISAFYADPQKRAEDRSSERAAFQLKSLTLEHGFTWQVRRLARFWGRWLKGVLRRGLFSPLSRAKRDAQPAARSAPLLN